MSAIVKVSNERVPEGQPPIKVCRVWCPGCDESHRVPFQGGPVVWDWDGNEEAPTFSPSILIRGNQWPKDEYPEYYKSAHSRVAPGDDTVCHSFIRDGRWEFLGDCTHALAGQTVDMVPLPGGVV